MHDLRLLALLGSLLASAGCQAAPTAQTAIAQAKQAKQAAATAGSEWLGVADLISKAEQALANHDSDMAMMLATQAKDLANLGLAQVQPDNHLSADFLQ